MEEVTVLGRRVSEDKKPCAKPKPRRYDFTVAQGVSGSAILGFGGQQEWGAYLAIALNGSANPFKWNFDFGGYNFSGFGIGTNVSISSSSYYYNGDPEQTLAGRSFVFDAGLPNKPVSLSAVMNSDFDELVGGALNWGPSLPDIPTLSATMGYTFLFGYEPPDASANPTCDP